MSWHVQQCCVRSTLLAGRKVGTLCTECPRKQDKIYILNNTSLFLTSQQHLYCWRKKKKTEFSPSGSCKNQRIWPMPLTSKIHWHVSFPGEGLCPQAGEGFKIREKKIAGPRMQPYYLLGRTTLNVCKNNVSSNLPNPSPSGFSLECISFIPVPSLLGKLRWKYPYWMIINPSWIAHWMDRRPSRERKQPKAELHSYQHGACTVQLIGW